MSELPSEISPIVLANSGTKSRVYFRTLRWQGRRRCPSCQHWRKLYRLDDSRFKCAQCQYRFGEWTGTYLERLRIPFDELAHLLYLFTLGVPSYRSQRYVNVSLKTAQKVYTTIRQSIYDANLVQATVDPLSGEVELDETMYGGHRKGKRGWGAAGKHLVFGLYQRNGQVLTFPVPDRKTDTLIPLVIAHTKAGSLYYSDNWHAYTWLSVKGNHVVVEKERGAPKAKGRDHINGIEGFWSYSKNWLYQARGIPRHHFHLYLKETEFRFNNRHQDLFPIMASFLVKLVPNLT
jgi:transposase